MLNRKEETKIVKAELAKYGINARVSHGRGTGWGWLDINVGSGQQFSDEHILDDCNTHRNCPMCKAARLISEFAQKIAQQVTGRGGEYGGNILCLTQNHWTDKKGNIPIEHNLTKLFKAIPELREIKRVCHLEPTRASDQQAIIKKAIREGRAYLHTFVGERKVTSYNWETGWAITNNTGDYYDQRSFMVCPDQIKIR